MDERNPPGLWLPYATIEEMRERQRKLIADNARREQQRHEEAARRAAIQAAPCRRCGKTGSYKYDYFCGTCDSILDIVAVIEACGGMNQTADALAERLEAAGYSFEEDR